MEKRAYALAAGLFVLVLGVALVAGVLWLNRDERVGGVPYEVTTTRPVSGLKVEAPVRFRGVDVGKVESIRFDPSEAGPGRHRHHRRAGRADDAQHLRAARLPGRHRAVVRGARRRRREARTAREHRRAARAHPDAAVAVRHRRRSGLRVRRGGRAHQQAARRRQPESADRDARASRRGLGESREAGRCPRARCEGDRAAACRHARGGERRPRWPWVAPARWSRR